LLYLLLTLIAFFCLFPFLWLLATALKPAGAVYTLKSFKDLIPYPISLRNFIDIWKELPLLGKFFFNTLWICFWGVIFELSIAALAAYPLAKLEFPGKNFIALLLLSTLMLPAQASMMVNFVTIRNLHLFDTYTAIILPSLVSVFGIFILRQAYIVIPGELEDAARIDGASELKIWWTISLPLSKPALGVLAVFSWMAYWNTFMWPLIILKHEAKYPLAVGLSYIANMFSSDFRLVAAGCIISMLPVIILFLFTQQFFLSGLTKGALK
jgi:putative chitobiose transport system permease protein